MKKLFLLGLIVPFFFACNQDETGTKLIIDTDNLDSDYIVLNGSGGFKDTIFVGEDGLFVCDFDSVGYQGYYIILNNEIISFDISTDETVKMTFDASSIEESVKFSGDRADINNYKADTRRNPNYKAPNTEMYGLEYAEYKAWADENLKAQLDLYNNYKKQDETDSYWITEEANIMFKWATQLGMYSIYYERFGKEDEVTLPEDYLEYRNQLDFNNPAYLKTSSFTTYMVSIIKEDARNDFPELDGVDLTFNSLQTATELIENEKVLDYIRVTLISNQISNTGLTGIQPCLDFFRNNSTDSEQQARLEKVYKEWQKIDKGQQGFDFVAEDLEGNDVKFSDFKGKYIYVDVWATWCAPCKREIPFLKQLEADYHDRNIVFVSYSIDSNREAWLDFVPKNELGGVQIIGEDAWNSSLPKYYKVHGVPTFMFFDPDGKIINIKMTRPSNPETRVTFNSYMDL